ncbi:MAG: DNA-3-methyladenine glycosylase 2 family protein [Armatimonadetes bacterium]|nr:DNA-3-methyladenine glycosylase 2 family protein [Armatimonadota bacterium]
MKLLTPRRVTYAVKALTDDPILGPVVARCEKPEFQMSDCVFSSLARAIISQQLSTKAAATIYGRFLKLIRKKKPDAKAVRKCTVEQLRGVGMSRLKASYLLDLADKTLSGELHIGRLAAMPNDEVIAEITNVKGLGAWSADMFLMFALCRPDVWPVGDLGIQNGVRNLLGREERLPIDELHEVAEAWRPYRTVAARYVWDSLDNKPL